MPIERRICRTCGTPDTVPAALCTTCGPVSGIQVRDADWIFSVVCERCDKTLEGVATSLAATCLACGGSAFGWRDGSGSWSKTSIDEAPGCSGPWIRAAFDGTCSGYDPAATGSLLQSARRFNLRITDGVLTDPVRVTGPPISIHSGEDAPIRQAGVSAVMIVPDVSVGSVAAQSAASTAVMPPAGNYRVALEDFRLHDWRFISVESPALKGSWSTGRITGTAYARLSRSPKSKPPSSTAKSGAVASIAVTAERANQQVKKAWDAITPSSVRDPVISDTAVLDCPTCNRWLIAMAALLLWWLCDWRTGLVCGVTALVACAAHGWACRNGIGFHRWKEPWRFRASAALGLFLVLLAIPLLAESIRSTSLVLCGRWFPENYVWLFVLLCFAGLQTIKWFRWLMHLVMFWALLAACVNALGSCNEAAPLPANEASPSAISNDDNVDTDGAIQTLVQSATAIMQSVGSTVAQTFGVDPETELVEGLNVGGSTGMRLVSVSQAAANPERYLQCIVGPDGRSVPQYGIYLGYDAFFSRNSAELRDSSANASLQELLDVVAATPQGRFVITGHTDTTGTDEINIPLSRARAEAVVAWLVSRGVVRDRLEAVGEGSTIPLVRPAASFEAGGYLAGLEEISLSTDLSERINRRVEVAINCPQGDYR